MGHPQGDPQEGPAGPLGGAEDEGTAGWVRGGGAVVEFAPAFCDELEQGGVSGRASPAGFPPEQSQDGASATRVRARHAAMTAQLESNGRFAEQVCGSSNEAGQQAT